MFFASANAQKTFEFHFDTSLRFHPPSFHHLRLIDDRDDKSNLGSVQNARGRVVQKIVCSGNFIDEFDRYSHMLASSAYPSKDSVLLVLKNFEVRFHGPVTTLYFRGVFFTGKNDRYYLVKDVDTLFEWMDSRKHYKFRSDQANTPLYDLLYDALQSVPQDEIEYNTSDLVQYYSRLNKSHFAIYNASAYKRGIYYTVDAFLENRISDTPFVRCDVTRSFDKTVQFCYAGSNGKKIAYFKAIFAVCDGGFFYIRFAGAWEKLVREGDEFYTERIFSGIKGANPYGVGLVPAIINTAEGDRSFFYYKARFDPIKRRYFRTERVENRGLNNEAALKMN